MKRMWINAPSTQQRDHKYHGQRVLVPDTGHQFDNTKLVYFVANQPVVGMEAWRLTLDPGWPTGDDYNWPEECGRYNGCDPEPDWPWPDVWD